VTAELTSKHEWRSRCGDVTTPLPAASSDWRCLPPGTLDTARSRVDCRFGRRAVAHRKSRAAKCRAL